MMTTQSPLANQVQPASSTHTGDRQPPPAALTEVQPCEPDPAGVGYAAQSHAEVGNMPERPVMLDILQRLGLAVLDAVDAAGEQGAPGEVLFVAAAREGACLGLCYTFLTTMTKRAILTRRDELYGMTRAGQEFRLVLRDRVAQPVPRIECPKDWDILMRWRRDGSYINIRHPRGGSTAISNKYCDKKWRIADDPRRRQVGGEGDLTYRGRNAAARAEYVLAVSFATAWAMPELEEPQDASPE